MYITGLNLKKNQRKNVNISLPIIFNKCFGCSIEPSHWEGSFEYPQHMFWLRNKKIKSWFIQFYAQFWTPNQPTKFFLFRFSVNNNDDIRDKLHLNAYNTGLDVQNFLALNC